MRRLSLLSLLTLPGLGSCGGAADPATSAPAARPVAAATPVPDAATAAADRQRVQQFLRWYLGFAERRDTTLAPLLNYVLPPAGPARQEFLAGLPRGNISRVGYVTLNPRKARAMAASLQVSGYFTAGFLSRHQAGLQQRGAALAAERQTEAGAAPGFEADEVFNTQDLYQPADIAHLTLAPNQPAAAAGPAVYQLPVGPDAFLLYTRHEAGRVAIDSLNLR